MAMASRRTTVTKFTASTNRTRSRLTRSVATSGSSRDAERRLCEFMRSKEVARSNNGNGNGNNNNVEGNSIEVFVRCRRVT